MQNICDSKKCIVSSKRRPRLHNMLNGKKNKEEQKSSEGTSSNSSTMPSNRRGSSSSNRLLNKRIGISSSSNSNNSTGLLRQLATLISNSSIVTKRHLHRVTPELIPVNSSSLMGMLEEHITHLKLIRNGPSWQPMIKPTGNQTPQPSSTTS